MSILCLATSMLSRNKEHIFNKKGTCVMTNMLSQLRRHSVVVADTGDLDAIRKFGPQDATTNPSLILKAVQSGGYDAVLDSLVKDVQVQSLSVDRAVEVISDRLIVAMGKEILALVPGRVSTEVDARLSFDSGASISKARQIIAHYEELGVGRERVLIKLAATWEGIRAAEALEKEGINCNLTLVFNFYQAQACAEAGVFLISPFVGRILDWYQNTNPELKFAPADEPGVQAVQRIYRYFRRHQYATLVMGASFRNVGEIKALAGCDRLTIAPALLTELADTQGELPAALFEEGDHESVPMTRLSEAQFRVQMKEDLMASGQLDAGIRGFEADQVKLEALLRGRLAD